MKNQLRPALVSLGVLTIVTGFIYPGLVTGAAQAFFPRQANGSLIVRDGRTLGSSLIGQPFDQPRYFWGRLSATGPAPYTAFNAEKATGSGGSNLGPFNPVLLGASEARIKALREAHPTAGSPVPVDLVTASASGLDPDISPAAASYQVPRVAKARGLPEDSVRNLVLEHTRHPQFAMLGEDRVNVLELNLALDARAGGHR
ncbi:MAG: potassium-transporting ATPase subunit KdpC [Planctomycetaceae bacterium]|nr:potassium-transporting ATPase subunit KdpC [Planctomycetaceae bacterium]